MWRPALGVPIIDSIDDLKGTLGKNPLMQHGNPMASRHLNFES